jgi:two-component sensor histidine kinase
LKLVVSGVRDPGQTSLYLPFLFLLSTLQPLREANDHSFYDNVGEHRATQSELLRDRTRRGGSVNRNAVAQRSQAFRLTVENGNRHLKQAFRCFGLGLAANQDLLVRNEWQGVDVEDLVRAQLAHFADLVGSRITVHGSPLRLNAAAAQAIGLALHELATNAGKYGALSVDAGRVHVGWRLDGDIFAMDWTESKGPAVSQPKRRGFGSTVVEPMVRQTVNGDVHLDFIPAGITWTLTCPATNALERYALYNNSPPSMRQAPAPAYRRLLRQSLAPIAH